MYNICLEDKLTRGVPHPSPQTITYYVLGSLPPLPSFKVEPATTLAQTVLLRSPDVLPLTKHPDDPVAHPALFPPLYFSYYPLVDHEF